MFLCVCVGSADFDRGWVPARSSEILFFFFSFQTSIITTDGETLTVLQTCFTCFF